MQITVITLFPEIFETMLNYSIIKRAKEKGLVEFIIINHRDFGIGPHKIVDDKPYGGGAGMVLKVDVLLKAIKKAKRNISGEKVILLDPRGKVFRQETAEKLSKISHIILVCGHYEGFDERIRKYVDMEISIGDFVLTGGEIPAIAIIDSIVRLLPNVLRDEATTNESHSKIDGKRILEGPQYTRPQNFEEHLVPKVYLMGDPKKIIIFKKAKAHTITKKVRPDLLK